MDEFTQLLKQREHYDKKMGEVLNGTLHLKKEGTRVSYPLSEEQKKKDLFLYKYFEFHYNRLDTLIHNSIYNIHESVS